MKPNESFAAAYGLYFDDVDIAEVVHTLNSAGFSNEDLFLMLAPTHQFAVTVRDANLLNADASPNDAAARIIAWCSTFGAVVIPTVGFFIRSQAFLHALTVARNAPAFCGSSGTLASLGFPGEDAERLEEQLLHDGYLVYVAASEAARMRWATELLRASGALETATLERAAGAVA